MNNQVYSKRTPIRAAPEALFAYHEQPGAFTRLNPPWEPVEVTKNTGGIQDGAEVEIKMRIGPVPQKWELVHRNYQANHQFEDVQVKGPFAHWVHTHKMLPNGGGGSVLEDTIEYRLPLGALGRIVGGRLAKAKLERMFRFRHEITAQDMADHQQFRDSDRLRVAVTGSTGLIGSQLVPFLTTGGHQVKRVVRSQAEDSIYWSPADGVLNPDELDGVDAVVHLAGENIGGRRWGETQKQRILDSRVKGTRLLAETSAKMENKPKVLVMVSAIGYYGNRGQEVLNEDSAAGDAFLSEVCAAWEAAAAPAIEAGIRVVTLRLGIVLSMTDGALKKMLPPFQVGLGGALGSGEQVMSWVALDDVIGAIHFALMNDEMQGVYNLTAPQPVTNRQFSKVLGRVLGRPALFPVPAIALRLLFGKLADELLLYSQRVDSKRLQNAGYEFRYATLEAALRHVLAAPTEARLSIA